MIGGDVGVAVGRTKPTIAIATSASGKSDTKKVRVTLEATEPPLISPTRSWTSSSPTEPRPPLRQPAEALHRRFLPHPGTARAISEPRTPTGRLLEWLLIRARPEADPAPRRRRDGRQRALGPPAGAEAHRGPRRRRGGPVRRRRGRPRARHRLASPSTPSPPRTGGGRPTRSATSWASTRASSCATPRTCTAATCASASSAGATGGCRSGVLRRMEEATDLTERNTGMTLTIAFNYGGRAEIVDAVRALVAEGVSRRQDRREGDRASTST